MVHPLNDLKDLKKARTEIGKAKKAVTGAPITRAYFDSTISNLRAEFAEQVAEALAPVRAALEIDELDQELELELDGDGSLPIAVEGEEDERTAGADS
jgi:hypothetical protein